MADHRPYPVPLAVGAMPAGLPIPFTQGPFTGKTIRTSVTELQKADAGRRYARKDKRPLDPPPVVQVRFFEVRDPGSPAQRERELLAYDEALVLGLLCQVDLFPIPDEVTPEGIAGRNANNPMTGVIMNPISSHTVPYGSSLPGALAKQPFPLMAPAIQGQSAAPTGSGREFDNEYPAFQPQAGPSALSASTLMVPLHPPVQTPSGPPSQNPNDVIAYYSNYAITESSNCTHVLAGARVANAMAMEYSGRPTLAFVFNDLAVQQEGSYTLRYRVFSIFAKTADLASGTYSTPILASCFGGVFKIWSSKAFPGLSPSTALTRRLSLYGTHVNIRSADRKKKRAKTDHYRGADSGSGGAGTPQSDAAGSSAGDYFSVALGGARATSGGEGRRPHSGDWVGSFSHYSGSGSSSQASGSRSRS